MEPTVELGAGEPAGGFGVSGWTTRRRLKPAMAVSGVIGASGVAVSGVTAPRVRAAPLIVPGQGSAAAETVLEALLVLTNRATGLSLAYQAVATQPWGGRHGRRSGGTWASARYVAGEPAQDKYAPAVLGTEEGSHLRKLHDGAASATGGG